MLGMAKYAILTLKSVFNKSLGLPLSVLDKMLNNLLTPSPVLISATEMLSHPH